MWNKALTCGMPPWWAAGLAAGWVVGLVGWLVSWLVSWLVGWLVGWMNSLPDARAGRGTTVHPPTQQPGAPGGTAGPPHSTTPITPYPSSLLTSHSVRCVRVRHRLVKCMLVGHGSRRACVHDDQLL